MYNLNDLTEDLGDWNLREASYITEDGWILTWGHPRNGGYAERNWLKPILDEAQNPDPDLPSTPLPQTGPNVETPEPISAALLPRPRRERHRLETKNDRAADDARLSRSSFGTTCPRGWPSLVVSHRRERCHR